MTLPKPGESGGCVQLSSELWVLDVIDEREEAGSPLDTREIREKSPTVFFRE